MYPDLLAPKTAVIRKSSQTILDRKDERAWFVEIVLDVVSSMRVYVWKEGKEVERGIWMSIFVVIEKKKGEFKGSKSIKTTQLTGDELSWGFFGFENLTGFPETNAKYSAAPFWWGG